jgi:hypothetical protein
LSFEHGEPIQVVYRLEKERKNSGRPNVGSHRSGLNMPLRRDVVTLGRAGAGVDVEIDDPLLAYRHATLKRQKDGTWLITAEPTRNGVWVSASTVALTSNCRFRCGEQQFWFVIP